MNIKKMKEKSIVKKGVVSVGFLALLVMAVMAAMALPVSAQDGDKIVIAHRGASGYLPEHTLEAYTMAYALGADYIEPDLVLTDDSVFICLHDIHLERTTNVEEVFPDRHRGDGRWYAADFSLEEIKQLDVHERCNEDGTPVFPGRFPVGDSQFKVPTFVEMIELIQGLNKATGRDVGIYPEIKKPSWHETEGLPMEEALLNIFNQYGYEGQDAKVYVQCFEVEPLKKMRFDLGTDLPLVQLIGGGTEYDQMVTEEGLDEIATYANGIGPSKVRIEDNPDLVNWAHERELVLHPWTFRADYLPAQYQNLDEELHQFYIVYDADGLFTDFPDMAAQFLQKLPPQDGDVLVGRAVLPAYTFALGPTSGQFIGEGPINGVLPPFIAKQPVQGFSAILKKDEESFYAMSDNGFGRQGNSQDYVLRIYEVRPEFETAIDGNGTIEVAGFIALHDPDELIPFTIVADLDEYPTEGTAPKDNIPSGISVDPAIKEGRLLTGADFDIESIQQIEDGTFWIGDEFGPFLLHVDAEGKVLDSPIPLPNVSSPQNPYLEDPADANLPRSRGFEGMALSVDGSRLYPMLEGALITDPDQTRRIINEFDLSSKSYIGNQFYYRMEDPTHAIDDFIAINEYEFLVIERDGSQGDLNGFKKIFRVDLSNLDSDGFVEKAEVVDLLNISDPDLISLPADPGDIGLGDPFAFPFVTIEDVVIIDSSTLGVLNDNNYPFSTGRKPNEPDDNEFILVRLDETLNTTVSA